MAEVVEAGVPPYPVASLMGEIAARFSTRQGIGADEVVFPGSHGRVEIVDVGIELVGGRLPRSKSTLEGVVIRSIRGFMASGKPTIASLIGANMLPQRRLSSDGGVCSLRLRCRGHGVSFDRDSFPRCWAIAVCM